MTNFINYLCNIAEIISLFQTIKSIYYLYYKYFRNNKNNDRLFSSANATIRINQLVRVIFSKNISRKIKIHVVSLLIQLLIFSIFKRIRRIFEKRKSESEGFKSEMIIFTVLRNDEILELNCYLKH